MTGIGLSPMWASCENGDDDKRGELDVHDEYSTECDCSREGSLLFIASIHGLTAKKRS